MADTPKEGKLTRFLDFTQLIDLASECVGGKVSRALKCRKSMLGSNTEGPTQVTMTQSYYQVEVISCGEGPALPEF